MVLDGIVDPEQNLGDRLVEAAGSFDRSLAEILNACGLDCPITGDPRQAYRDLAEAVRTNPLDAGDATDVGFNAVAMAGLAVTYDEELRAPFYEAIAQGQRGDGISSRCSPRVSSRGSISDRRSPSTASTDHIPPRRPRSKRWPRKPPTPPRFCPS